MWPRVERLNELARSPLLISPEWHGAVCLTAEGPCHALHAGAFPSRHLILGTFVESFTVGGASAVCLHSDNILTAATATSQPKKARRPPRTEIGDSQSINTTTTIPRGQEWAREAAHRETWPWSPTWSLALFSQLGNQPFTVSTFRGPTHPPWRRWLRARASNTFPPWTGSHGAAAEAWKTSRLFYSRAETQPGLDRTSPST